MSTLDFTLAAILMWLFGFAAAWNVWTLLLHNWPDGPGWTRPRAWTLIVAELKTGTGALSREQQTWLALWRLVTPNVRVWRPRDWREVWADLK